MDNLNQFYPGLNEGFRLPLRNLQGAGLMTFGNIWFVSSGTGSDTANNGKAPNNAFATISAAISAATATNGDVILVLPGHSETRTSAITVNKAGISILGLGQGLVRPSITGNGTIDAFDITAANVLLENFQFPAPSTDDQTSDVNVSGAGVTLRHLYSIGSQTSKNKTDIITVASGANDLIVEFCRAYNSVVDCVSWLSLEAAVARPVIRDNYVRGQFSTANIMDEATATDIFLQRNVFVQTKAAVATANFTNNSTGTASFNHMGGRNTTLASNLVTGTGIDWFENRVTEEGSLNGAIIPAADTD